MSLRLKLIGAFLVAVLAAGALAGTSFFATWSLGDIAKALYDRPLQSINFARSAQTNFLVMELEERLTGAATEERLARLREDFFIDLEVATDRRMSERTLELAETLHTDFEAWWDAAHAARNDPAMKPERDAIADRLKVTLDILVQVAAEDGYRFWLAAEQSVNDTKRLTSYILAGVLVVSLIVAGLLARNIIRPLNRLAKGTISLASGDRSVAVDARDQARGDEIGGMARSLLVFRDVMNEVREARDSAEAAAKAKSDFLAMMSHEIRTPMNGVIGMTRLLLRRPLGTEEKHFAETVLESAEGLMHLLNGILDFSKLEAGKLDLELLDFDLRRMVDGSLALMQGRAEEKGLTFQADVDSDCPRYLKGDSARLRQVLLNLVGNALKFTEEGGVTVSVSPAGTEGTYRFRVTDTGIGIPPDKVDRLFQEFSQADSSTARQYGGTGLGLAICKQIVELMGGRIAVDSVPGTGSTFWFEIPLADGAMPDNRDLPASAEKLPPLTLLVAEDNLVNQQVARGLLEAEGHTVKIVPDGAAALAALEAEPPGTYDAVLMDMNMPVMDGLEATRRIRALDPPLSGIPIVAATAAATAEEIQRCLAAGMDTYVAKPIHPGLLFGALARVLKLEDPDGGSDDDGWEDDFPEDTASPVTERLMQDGPALEPDILATYRDQLGAEFADEMVSDFLGTIDAHTAIIEEHLTARNITGLSEAAHTLKSAAASVGLRDVYRAALSVETRAEADHLEECAASAEHLLAALEQSRTLFDSQAAR
ncbi:ATP-binding protein [uncultured Nisaea sp.]|uniref:ATP-binding protein n=1 Tax=uncultured Nisaea sp. TaxID=538215 RepID=UPI0030EC0B72|tara:strand:+ start:29 stop:2329 length:2301 start_codon:yes stop_codon:yes gene_type:complete